MLLAMFNDIKTTKQEYIRSYNSSVTDYKTEKVKKKKERGKKRRRVNVILHRGYDLRLCASVLSFSCCSCEG
ncbi:hypothetical protein F2Q70_00042166 [Brassica cretica]|uniref:Uncharacterized protein n=2 Tax=Brassica cretica TaxID=69181 RepID=A0A8S9MRB9_BRACR|nr:hypothetical protein F2Q70_00042166 [Brassica cretica]KAF2621017.1 hypothetical protein F2Q68_00042831 [Brassica cretica]KAF3493741.1 hypothetical protein DY000_02058301 [Brassica cretica]